jgi:hypothetical protein
LSFLVVAGDNFERARKHDYDLAGGRVMPILIRSQRQFDELDTR